MFSLTRFSRAVVRLAPLALVLCPMDVHAQQPTFADIVGRSGFIFEGTVKAVGEATATMAKSPNTAIVLVDRIIEVQKPFGDFTGKEVTVRLRNPEKTRPGDRAVFYTYVQAAGATLGLVEVSSEPLRPQGGVDSRVKDARATLADRALASRLATAQLVVVGVIGEGKPTEVARERRSEHDPMPWAASIKVETVLKGKADGQVVAIYASSDDVMWERSPKPQAGFEGVFLLQPDRDKRFGISGLFLIDPLDVQPKAELQRVQRLLKPGR